MIGSQTSTRSLNGPRSFLDHCLFLIRWWRWERTKNANMHQNHPNLSRCVPKVTRMTLWEAGTHIKACVPSSIPLLVERALGEATACSWLFMERGPILHKSHTFQRWISQKGRLHHLPQLKRHLLLLFHHKYTDSTKQCPCRPHLYKLSAIEWRKVSYSIRQSIRLSRRFPVSCII